MTPSPTSGFRHIKLTSAQVGALQVECDGLRYETRPTRGERLLARFFNEGAGSLTVPVGERGEAIWETLNDMSNHYDTLAEAGEPPAVLRRISRVLGNIAAKVDFSDLARNGS